MAEDIFNADFLFSNFDSPNEGEGDVSAKVKLLRKKAPKTDGNIHGNKSTSSNNSAQEKYINELEDQNAKLKGIIKRMMGPQVFDSNDDLNIDDDDLTNGDNLNLLEKLSEDIKKKPFAIVLYLNNDVSTAHRKDIDDAMRNISAKQSTQEVLMSQKLQPQSSAVPVKAFATNSKGRRSNVGKSKNSHEHYIVCACQYFKTFFIDRMGAPWLEDNPEIVDIWEVPTYPQIFLKALPIVEETSNIRVRQLKQCFNCGGEHHLSDCTEPKDENRIRKSRAEFSATKPPGSGFQTPLPDEIDERFKHFKAGEISVGLEEALGISLKTQLPPYIYKMREMGYPPGWLKPADERGLKLYGSDGEEEEDPGFEEGEIKPIKLPEIVIYPGFNAPAGEDVEDTAEQFGMPPFRPDLVDLDIARKRAQILGYDPNETVRKKLKFDKEGDSDMEVEEDEDGEIVEGGKPPLPLIETSEDYGKPPPPPDDPEASVKKKRSAKKKQKSKGKSGKDTSKTIDEKTYRNWYVHEPLSSIGITYVIFTPPPACRGEVSLLDIPKYINTDIDREPWKTASVSWYDPLYGDLEVARGTYDNIRTLLKENKTPRRKSGV